MGKRGFSTAFCNLSDIDGLSYEKHEKVTEKPIHAPTNARGVIRYTENIIR